MDKSIESPIVLYCRLCAGVEGSISVYDITNSNGGDGRERLTYKEQIKLCTQIEVSNEDGLPSILCPPCCSLLSTCYTFWQRCHQAQTQLKQLLQVFSNLKIEVQSDDDFNNELFTDGDEHKELEKKEINKTVSKSCPVKHENNLKSCTAQSYEYLESSKETVVKQENVEPSDVFDIDVDIKDSIIGDDKTDLNNIESSTLLNPFKIKYKNGRKFYQCNSCNKSYKSRTLVKQHVRRHCKQRSGENTFKKTRRKNRIVKKREAVREECKNLDTTSPYVSDVEDVECMEADKKYKCKYCEKTYKTILHLRRHKQKYCRKKESLILRNYMCDQCGRTFKKRSILVQHMGTHASKMFSCNICGKHFTRGSHVLVHMRIHNNYKPYVCEMCGRPFTKSSDLLRHKRIHSDARNYSCPICPKTFKRSGDVAIHLRVHTGDRPYKCEACFKTYTNHSSLQKHRRTNCLLKDKPEDAKDITSSKNKPITPEAIVEA